MDWLIRYGLGSSATAENWMGVQFSLVDVSAVPTRCWNYRGLLESWYSSIYGIIVKKVYLLLIPATG